MKKQIDEMVALMCEERKKHKSCKACKSGNPNANAYCRIEKYAEALYNAGYHKASEIFEEIIDALADERIKEEQKANSALEAQDTMSYEIFSYAEDKLGTLLTALEIYKNLYLKKYEREGAE